MKFILLLTMFFSSFTASAAPGKDPKYCPNQQDSCSVKNGLFSKIYYAKGEGRTCAEAWDDSFEVFEKRFGKMDCGDAGLNPDYQSYCFKTNRGISLYAVCNPSSKTYSQSAKKSSRTSTYIQGMLFH